MYCWLILRRGLTDTLRVFGWWTLLGVPLCYGIGLLVHLGALHWFPESKRLLGEPMAAWWINAVYLLVPLAAVALIVALFNVLLAPSRIWREQRIRISELEAVKTPLQIVYDDSSHKFAARNGQSCMFRVAVVNTGSTTTKNVTLRITGFQGRTKRLTNEVRQFIRLPLAISEDPTGPTRAFRAEPRTSALLHQEDSVIFDFVRLCKVPKGESCNYSIWHGQCFTDRKHTSDGREIARVESQPQQSFPSGKYEVTLSAAGDDLPPVTAKFEFWTTSRAIIFRQRSQTE